MYARFRLAGGMLFSSVDPHKRTVAIQTVDGEGTVVCQAQLAALRPALTAYFATLQGPHRAVVQRAGMWYWVRDLLSPQGISQLANQLLYANAIGPTVGQIRAAAGAIGVSA